MSPSPTLNLANETFRSSSESFLTSKLQTLNLDCCLCCNSDTHLDAQILEWQVYIYEIRYLKHYSQPQKYFTLISYRS